MQKNKNRGFSLIELLIAVAILSIIMVMISGFLSSTLIAQRKTKKSMQMQTEAQKIYYQLSEMLMQATYVRVQIDSRDRNVYVYDAESRSCVSDGTKSLNSINLVPDNYANYQLGGRTQERKVRVDYDTGELYADKTNLYPAAGNEIDIDDTSVISFRALTKETAKGVYQAYYYIIPEYIYIEYSSGKDKKSYAIYQYDKDNRTLSMYRPDSDLAANQVPSATVNFKEARDAIAGDSGVVSQYVENFYLTADPDGNAISFSMKLADKNYEGYGYQLNDTVKIRNSYVLSVKPQLLFPVEKTTP